MRRAHRRRARGMLGLAALALAFVVAEAGARAWHDPRDADFLFDWFHWDSRLARAWRARTDRRADPAPGDRAIPITAEGYRGTFSLESLPDPDRRRVLVTGAGHLFGQDVPWGAAATEVLERRLEEAGVPAEVWDLAVPGSTVLFVERGQLDAIVGARPDVVVLGHGGFNEALYAGVPEARVLHPDRPALNLALSSELLQLAVLRGSRWWRLRQGRGPQTKVPVETFVASLERVVERLRGEGADVVLLQQVVVNPDIPGVWRLSEMGPYRAAVADLADRHKVPLVDPLVAFEPPLERWFADREYYTADAHAAVGALLAPLVEALLRRQAEAPPALRPPPP